MREIILTVYEYPWTSFFVFIMLYCLLEVIFFNINRKK